MTYFVVAMLGLSAQAVPLDSNSTFGGGVISRDATTWFATSGVISATNLKNGTGRDHRFLTFLNQGYPLKVIAATDGQGRLAPDTATVSPAARIPSLLGDALNAKRLLVVTNQETWKGGFPTYHILTEIRLERSEPDANLSWVVRHRSGTHIPVAARFVGARGVAMWELVKRRDGRDLVKYTGDRERPSYDLKQAFRIRTGLPRDIYEIQYLPESSTVVYRRNNDWGGLAYFRATLKGDVLGGVNLARFVPKRNPAVQALWELAVPIEKVPGENKEAWVPLSPSADLSTWLLKSVETGQLELHHLMGEVNPRNSQ